MKSRWSRRVVVAIRAGTQMGLRRIVAVAARARDGASVKAAARVRLNAMTAQISQTALALNTPEVRCDSAEAFRSPAAQGAVRRLDRPVQRRLLDALDLLGADPRPNGAKTLQGGGALLRIRVGDYRVVYAVQDDELVVLVLTLGHRREVYRKL